MLVGGVGRGIGGFPRAQSATAPMPPGGLLPKMHAASKEATMTTTPKPVLVEQAPQRCASWMRCTLGSDVPSRDAVARRRPHASRATTCTASWSSARTRSTRRATSGRGRDLRPRPGRRRAPRRHRGAHRRRPLASPVVLISGSDTLDRAAQLMHEHQTAHLLVVDPDTIHPVGVLSTLDVAAALVGEHVLSGPPRLKATEGARP